MNFRLTRNHYIQIAVILILTAFVIHWYINSRVTTALYETENTVRGQIAIQTDRVRTIADLTKQNLGDDFTKSLVKDCSGENRIQFERLLDKLSLDITRPELTQLDSLFYECARYTAEVKNIMVARLAQEVSIYTQHKQLLEKLQVRDEKVSNEIELWQQISDKEKEFAVLYAELVHLQREIIKILLAGKAKDSSEIKTTLTKVTEVKNSMTVLRTQIDNMRNEIATL